jgi:hypothetical protein
MILGRFFEMCWLRVPPESNPTITRVSESARGGRQGHTSNGGYVGGQLVALRRSHRGVSLWDLHVSACHRLQGCNELSDQPLLTRLDMLDYKTGKLCRKSGLNILKLVNASGEHVDPSRHRVSRVHCPLRPGRVPPS